MKSHVPVLLDEAIDQLHIDPDGIYVDCTFGRGGHARRILATLGPGGRLLAFDRDPEAVRAGRDLARDDERFSIEPADFGRLRDHLERHGVCGEISGIMADLGVSSPQLEDPRRGFSFRLDGPLDMRMNPASGPTAAEWLNTAGEPEIRTVLSRYGEEPAAARIARAICLRREERPVATTFDLAGLVEGIVRRKPGARHPATRTFQAVRIFINDELEALRQMLGDALEALRIGGRLVVISFHSLEDRAVKRFMRDQSRIDPALASLPVVPPEAMPRLKLTARAIRAGTAAVEANPRARSATLRAAERIR